MPKKILIIEDYINIVEILTMRLKALGFDVVCAYDGQATCDRFSEHHAIAFVQGCQNEQVGRGVAALQCDLIHLSQYPNPAAQTERMYLRSNGLGGCGRPRFTTDKRQAPIMTA